jgi:hypothetical protein
MLGRWDSTCARMRKRTLACSALSSTMYWGGSPTRRDCWRWGLVAVGELDWLPVECVAPCLAAERTPEELCVAPAQGTVGRCRLVLPRRSSCATGAAPLGRRARVATARVGGVRQRHRSLMRHPGAPVSVPGLPDRVQASPPPAGLVALSRAPEDAAAGALGLWEQLELQLRRPDRNFRNWRQPGTRTERADRLPVILGLRGPDRTAAHGSNAPATWNGWRMDRR